MDRNMLATPTRQQLAWQDMEMGLFCHFGINTFYDREWGEGKDSPEGFNPTLIDCRQWAATGKRAGFKYLILTAKHHDGFCLWQTATTDYSVKSSPWENGKGDVVKMCSQACREEGMHFGIYLSPWDRHEPCYQDKDAYDRFYIKQLMELLTGYGPLVEIWFDGAGSEGREYDWAGIMDAINRYQPDAMVFNMGRPTIRWVGNENGLAPYPCWNTASEVHVSMFSQHLMKRLPHTPCWIPAECDVPSRRKHWFWHPEDEKSLLSKEELLHIYYYSVGRGTNLLLNIAPDSTGLFPECDVQRVIELGDEIRKRFSNPIAETAGEGDVIELAPNVIQKADHAVIMEEIEQGERITEYVLEALSGDVWQELVHGSAIGHKKIDRFTPVAAAKFRLRIIQSDAKPIIRKFSIFNSEV